MAILRVDHVAAAMAHQVGTAPDLIKIVLCLALNFPLCAAVKRIPARRQRFKELFVLSAGAFYLVGIFSLWGGLLVMLGLSVVCYYFCYYFQRNVMMPWLNFATMIIALLFMHAKEQFTGEDFVNTIGISGSLMILVIKLSSFGWDAYDGTRPEKQLSTYQKDNRVLQFPTLLAFLSWCFFFPAVLTGPSCPYRVYGSWLDLSMLDGYKFTKKRRGQRSRSRSDDRVRGHAERDDNRVRGHVGRDDDKTKIKVGSDDAFDDDTAERALPRSGHVAFLKTVEAAIWAFLYFQSSNYFSSDFLFTDRYLQLPFLWRIAYLWGLAVCYMLKYFVAWSFADAACIHCGLGFNGVLPNGKLRWDRVINVRPMAILLAQNAHAYINNWNINTNAWLRNYVYLRVTPKSKRPGSFATLITFIVSAIWHGTRPGYYLTFFLCALFQIFGKLYRRRIRPIFEHTTYKYGYDCFTWAATQLAFGFAVQPFVLLDIGPSVHVWAAVYFYVLLILVASYSLLVWPLKGLTKRLLRQLRRDIATIE